MAKAVGNQAASSNQSSGFDAQVKQASVFPKTYNQFEHIIQTARLYVSGEKISSGDFFFFFLEDMRFPHFNFCFAFFFFAKV